MSATKIKIPSALRYLHKYGANALKPTKIPSITDIQLAASAATTTTTTEITSIVGTSMNNYLTSYHPINKRTRWIKPKVSKRVANTLRKKAIRNGTYGTYDPNTGIGWDAAWDNESNGKHNSNSNNANIPWMEIRPFKDTKRERTREARAKKIEDSLLTADDKILGYRLAQQEKKPAPGIENLIKRMMKNSRK